MNTNKESYVRSIFCEHAAVFKEVMKHFFKLEVIPMESG